MIVKSNEQFFVSNKYMFIFSKYLRKSIQINIY